MICPVCDTLIDDELVCGPVKCQCGTFYDLPQCANRGDRLGNASCGCGTVYRCNLLDKWCSTYGPAEDLELYTINFDGGTIAQLSPANYQSCSVCNDFTNLPT